MYIEVVQI